MSSMRTYTPPKFSGGFVLKICLRSRRWRQQNQTHKFKTKEIICFVNEL